ncbi:MAG: methyltransferase domain-containing protein [Nitrososphaerota archaeon]|nr:methyltransferase domain-containing protein [Nitrososphaerota archaeon]
MPVNAERIIAGLRLGPGSSLLVVGDVGAEILETFAGALGGLGNVTLLHREPEPPAWSRRLAEKGLKTRRSMLLEHNDFLPSSSFDAIFAYNILDKLLGKREFLSEAYRLLKPGGRLLLAQRLWPFTNVRGNEFKRLLERARSYTIIEVNVGLLSARALLERPQ